MLNKRHLAMFVLLVMVAVLVMVGCDTEEITVGEDTERSGEIDTIYEEYSELVEDEGVEGVVD